MAVAPKVVTMTLGFTSDVESVFRKGLSQRQGALLMGIGEPSFSSKQVGMVDMIIFHYGKFTPGDINFMPWDLSSDTSREGRSSNET